jgi:hypothetical protein
VISYDLKNAPFSSGYHIRSVDVLGWSDINTLWGGERNDFSIASFTVINEAKKEKIHDEFVYDGPVVDRDGKGY